MDKPYYEVKLVAVLDPDKPASIGLVSEVEPGPTLNAIKKGLWVEVTIPYHTDKATYGFVITIANKPADQVAIAEMLLLNTLAPQLYADFGHKAIAPGDDELIPGINICPFCLSDEVGLMMDYQAPLDYPYDRYKCDNCSLIWKMSAEDAERTRDNAKRMAMLSRIFKNAPEIQLKLNAKELFQALTMVQIAARAVLPLDHSFQSDARKFVAPLAKLISEATGEPDLVRYVERGWDPYEDHGWILYL